SRLAGLPRVGRLGLRAAGNPAVAHNAAFRALRRAAIGTVGYAYHFEPAECAARVEEAIRRIIRREEVALGVRGPMALGLPLPPRIAAESRARVADFERRVSETCARLHVAYQPPGPDEPPAPGELQADLTHVNARGHARRAEREYRLMLRALEATRGPAEA
ncbi:SGNH/GDSL hydrolase family protein, partial [Tepidiforma sp.]|uniref:SGNH/GDSL hydrolase family protein n=1 Tax=Tepidiforma sp. TaxID=2682230 RepID=UPI00261B692E